MSGHKLALVWTEFWPRGSSSTDSLFEAAIFLPFVYCHRSKRRSAQLSVLPDLDPFH